MVTVTGTFEMANGPTVQPGATASAFDVTVPITGAGGTIAYDAPGDSISGPVVAGTGGVTFTSVPSYPDGSLTVSGSISGSGPVAVLGNGSDSVTFTGKNSFSGPISVGLGTLTLVGDAATGAAGDSINVSDNGYLHLAGITSTSANINLLTGGLQVMCAPNGACGTLTDTGTVTAAPDSWGPGPAGVVVDPGETLVLAGDLKAATGEQLTLTGAVDLSHPLTSFQGIATADGTRLVAPTALDQAQELDTTHLLVQGPGTSAPPLRLTGSGTGLENVSGDSVFTGTVTCPPPLPMHDQATGAITVDSGTLSLTGVVSGCQRDDVAGVLAWQFSDIAKYGPGALVLGGTAANTGTGRVVVHAGTLQLAKPSGTIAVTDALVIGGGTFEGPTVQLLNADQIDPAAPVGIYPTGRLDLNGFNQTIDHLDMLGGTVTTGSGTLQVGSVLTNGGAISGTLSLGGSTRMFAGGPLTVPATITGASGAGIDIEPWEAADFQPWDAGPLIGALTVPAGTSDTYTGATTVGAGSLLQVDGSLSAASAVQLHPGALLRGKGSVGPVSGDGTVSGADGDASGALTVGGLTLASDASVAASFGQSSGCASCGTTVISLGPVDLSASPALAFASNGGSPVGSTWTIIDNRSGAAVNGTFAGKPEGSVFTTGNGDQFQITYHGGSAGNSVVVTEVSTTSSSSPPSSRYFALASPQRMEDTRTDGRRLAAGGTVDVRVAGGSTGVPADATSVVLNVTSTNNAGPGYLQVYPRGSGSPSSSVNYYYPGQLTQDLVTVPVDGATGMVTVLSSVPDDVVVDELGYFRVDNSTSAGQYVPLSPQRLCDTRGGPSPACPGGTTQASGSTLHLQVTGNAGVPLSGVSAVVVNLTVADDPSAGYVQAFAHSAQRPTNPPTSNINYNGESPHFDGDPCSASGGGRSDCQITANRVIVPVGPDGGVDLFVSQGPADLIVDVNGYFTDGSSASGQLFHPINETRLHDTRASGDTVAPHGLLKLGVAGTGSDGTSIPATASAAVLTVTIDKTSAASGAQPSDTRPGTGFLTVYPCGNGSPPLASDLNFGSDSIVPAQVYATLGPDGSITIYNGSSAAIDVIVDAYGYFQ